MRRGRGGGGGGRGRHTRCWEQREGGDERVEWRDKKEG